MRARLSDSLDFSCDNIYTYNSTTDFSLFTLFEVHDRLGEPHSRIDSSEEREREVATRAGVIRDNARVITA